MWIVMASSDSTTSERIAGLVRLQEQRALALGNRPGEVVPGAEIIVVRRNPESGRRQFDLLKWGLIPNRAPDQASPHLHARAETIAELPTFAKSFTKRRCIISIDLFTQRRTIGEPKGREFAFGNADGSDLFVAGIWDAWRVPGTENWIRTFATVTTEASDLVGQLHDRMPAILTMEQLPTWFGEVPASIEEVQGMLRPFLGRGMIRWPAKSKRPAKVEQEAKPPGEPDLFSPRT
jgi:putative SOS response-associated peptidase YedK